MVCSALLGYKHIVLVVHFLISGFSIQSSPNFGVFAFPVMTDSTSTTPGGMEKQHFVVIGGGIQGTSVAYHLAQRLQANTEDDTSTPPFDITLLEAVQPASAASGKGGGFMARSWGDGSPTQALHHVAFDLYEELAQTLNCHSYRKLPVLSVTPGDGHQQQESTVTGKNNFQPNWLNGPSVRQTSTLGNGSDTAQITPSEFVQRMIEVSSTTIQVKLGHCTGLETTTDANTGTTRVTGVQYTPNHAAAILSTQSTKSSASFAEQQQESQILPADAVIVCAGPWSCQLEDWLQPHGISLTLPMEGIKSTSIVWQQPTAFRVDATALFCGEDHRFGTHLECYPRPDGTLYICGIGGSDYVTTKQLQKGAFLRDCLPNESRVEAAMASFHSLSTLYQQHGQLDRTQACMRPCPPDALPYMGSIAQCDGLYVNAGHNCWGIAWAPACGKAMSELVLDGVSTTIDLNAFDPMRFTKVISNKPQRGRKKGSINVGEQW